ncbi:methylated-DNA--[protein]-cysteine S-methyltransferase [Alicyclobacillus sp. ALC3]|uniref:methylated-DNA--[protein]-cysteine S-methyltransferase n=1 Tax=Alicyclobacillus sp. ALC3 TaxID=2796143 RepID=UPI002379099A|nr:methylated-DNA--[protein]-cysteine S-methyltransferase [Alicyclobacillus sp. ALC3]WDL98661.1 methylated-DNA--[protein]-cysteine S-methyltransferase [Alicyclobacillus sp. ALC3]
MSKVEAIATAWRTVRTPLGGISVGATSEGVTFTDWVRPDEGGQTNPGQHLVDAPSISEDASTFISTARLDSDRDLAAHWAEQAIAELREYFQGRRQHFTVPVTLQGTAFQTAVWNALRDIPYGETRSYQDIANAIGNPRAVRAVGQANRRNPVSVIVPCHRVIGANGALVGYAGKHVDLKQRLLDLERAWR